MKIWYKPNEEYQKSLNKTFQWKQELPTNLKQKETTKGQKMFKQWKQSQVK